MLSGINAGTACKIYIVSNKIKTLVLDGFVSNRERSFSSDDHTVSISGNDKLIDLVDCSIITGNRVWVKKKLSAIIKSVAEPFSVEVDTTILLDDPLIDKYVLQPGESAFDTHG